MWIMICKVSSNFFKCCIELVTIVLKFCTYELFDMDNDVDYNVKLVAIVLIFYVNT